MVSSHFINVSLDETILVFLRRFYTDKEISTTIPKRMKELLSSYAKNAHFSFNCKIYIQTDCVTIGSPVGPVPAIIFTVELENTITLHLEHETKL